MQDDLYLIAADGWKAETSRVIEIKKNKDGIVTKEVDKGWVCDLVPKAIIVARYFAKDQGAINALTAELELTTASITELEEEHSGEDAVFSGFDKINKAAVNDRLKEIGSDKDAADEINVLKEWSKLNAHEADLKRQLKEAEAVLDAKALAHYPKLTEAEVKSLVVDDKWIATLDALIHGEMDRVSQGLTKRIRQLADRYDLPLPDMVKRLNELEAKVNAHLGNMGFAA